MDLKTYSDNAIRTAPDLGQINDYYHATFGLGSELGELLEIFGNHHIGYLIDASALREELGDLLWYSNLIVRRWHYDWDGIFEVAMNMAIPDATPNSVSFSFCRLAQAIGDLQDYAKKSLLAAKVIDRAKVEIALINIVAQINELVEAYNLDWDVIRHVNIAKLAKRYPEGTFDIKLSDNRDKAAEVEVMNATANR